MEAGTIQIICGKGTGKSELALGRAIHEVSRGHRVIVIQFLKGSMPREAEQWYKKLEPGLRLFSFEKNGEYFEDLDEQKKSEEVQNIQNGLHFAKKVLTTGECDMLILDEFLGLVDQKIVSDEMLTSLFDARDPSATLILTGRNCSEELRKYADSIIDIEKLDLNR
ncbi:MAG: cob(I)yrinic acid a,c-diamide adenosyltransferase [Bacillota bacterium]|nr:cob(I)yrinic acid a,c-diamide adenosyltransferase [Bacillota bacterium]